MLSDFQPEVIGKVSLAAKSLCMWVRAMEVSDEFDRNLQVTNLHILLCTMLVSLKVPKTKT